MRRNCSAEGCLNRALKGIKSDLIIDFICINYQDLIITSNRAAFSSDISINNYVKNCNNINVNNIQDAQLPQSKLYLKILGIPYLIEGTNSLINSEVMEGFIRLTYIFNNIKIASKLCIVKVSLRFNMMDQYMGFSKWFSSQDVLQLRNLSVGLGEEPCSRLIQENSIENSVQDGLPYIQIPNGLCELFLTYPKQPCICLKVNMHFPCCMTSSFQNLLPPSMCHVTCDHVIWCDLLCDSVILSL